MTMITSKKPLKSKGIIGGLIALSGALGMWLETNGTDLPIPDEYYPIITGVGAVLSIVGRIFATSTIRFKNSKTEQPVQ